MVTISYACRRLKSKPLPSLNLVVFLSTGFSNDLPMYSLVLPGEGSAIFGRFDEVSLLSAHGLQDHCELLLRDSSKTSKRLASLEARNS